MKRGTSVIRMAGWFSEIILYKKVKAEKEQLKRRVGSTANIIHLS